MSSSCYIYLVYKQTKYTYFQIAWCSSPSKIITPIILITAVPAFFRARTRGWTRLTVREREREREIPFTLYSRSIFTKVGWKGTKRGGGTERERAKEIDLKYACTLTTWLPRDACDAPLLPFISFLHFFFFFFLHR